jgi:hypothetical protein
VGEGKANACAGGKPCLFDFTGRKDVSKGQAERERAWCLATVFLALNPVFVYRSFYGMRIEQGGS